MQKATEKLSLLFSSCFAAGALAPAEPDQARTIYQAVVDKNWGTAKELLRAMSEGKLSGTVWSVSSLGEEHSVVDSWSFVKIHDLWWRWRRVAIFLNR